MSKNWKCRMCGRIESYGIVKSLSSEPEACSGCGGTEFDDPYVMGTVHKAIDKVIS